ncbi:hypothetical protein E2C01_026951 [Portunus trituberculatus]|uniref:Uncharacterized protein n=1 Tax=Portunus trituberculatus TaxID=210409 RepID=A0A5B7EK27_PORTR|nr:hypothetical protein [Portunus trituberculatus]
MEILIVEKLHQVAALAQSGQQSHMAEGLDKCTAYKTADITFNGRANVEPRAGENLRHLFTSRLSIVEEIFLRLSFHAAELREELYGDTCCWRLHGKTFPFTFSAITPMHIWPTPATHRPPG